jgi:hypothetical protein
MALLTTALILSCCVMPVIGSYAGDTEFLGSLDGELVPNTEDLDQITFKPFRNLSSLKFATAPPEGAAITAGRLYDPLRDKSAILTLLVLAEDEQPMLYADIDGDNSFNTSERFPRNLKSAAAQILQTTLQLPLKTLCSTIRSQFILKGEDELKEGETLMQSKAAFAKGTVQIERRKRLRRIQRSVKEDKR